LQQRKRIKNNEKENGAKKNVNNLQQSVVGRYR